eukprot:9857111-Ditylum_brightwellii.AAC.2
MRPSSNSSKVHDGSSSKHKAGPHQDSDDQLLHKFYADGGCIGNVGQDGKSQIKEVEDLAEFSKDIWNQVVESLKSPGGQMKNLDKEANQNHATVPQIKYLFGARR